MFKKIFLLLILVSFGNLYCQKDNYEVAKKEFENFIFSSDSIKIQNIKNEKFKKIIDIQEYYHYVTRLLDFGLTESVYELRFMYSSNHILKGRGVELHIFYLGEKEIGKIIDYSQYKDEEKQISSKFDSVINNYIVKHNHFYKTNYSQKNFIDDIITKNVYGDYCGYSGSKNEKMFDLELEKLNNVESYVNWMKSFNPEKQMWGYDQIQYLLGKELIDLEADEQKIFTHIKSRNAIIQTCSGCTFGIFERVFKNKNN
ncbi:MAG: hypothetical protein DI529_01590 [Chryseobacterium sp.]|nr:MAG: hypothetical protein DI529_01590 [Chryseobacterium sp.]